MDFATEQHPRSHLKLIRQHQSAPVFLASALETLCMALVLGQENYLRAFDVQAGLKTLLDVDAKNALAGDCVVMRLRAIALVLEHVPGSSQAASQHGSTLIKLISDSLLLQQRMTFDQTTSAMLFEESMRVLQAIAIDLATSIVSSGLVATLVQRVFPTAVAAQKQCLETLTTVALRLPSSSNQVPPKAKGSGVFRRGAPSRSPLETFVVDVMPRVHAIIDSNAEWAVTEAALALIDGSLHRIGRDDRLAAICAPTPLIGRLAGSVASRRPAQTLAVTTTLLTLARMRPAAVSEAFGAAEFQAMAKSVLAVERGADLNSFFANPFDVGRSGDGTSVEQLCTIQLLLMFLTIYPPHAQYNSNRVVVVHKWFWEDDLHTYIEYSEEQSKQLEELFLNTSGNANKNTQVRVEGRTYDVDVATMLQGRSGGGPTRHIRRASQPTSFRISSEQQFYKRDAPSMVTQILRKPMSSTPAMQPSATAVLVPQLCLFMAHTSSSILKCMSGNALVSIIRVSANIPQCMVHLRSHELMTLMGSSLCECLNQSLDPATQESAMLAMALLIASEDGLFFSLTCNRYGALTLLDALKRSGENEGVRHSSKEVLAALQVSLANASEAAISGSGTTLKEIVLKFSELSCEGQHTLLPQLLTCVTDAMETLTPFEVQQLGLAQILLDYLDVADEVKRKKCRETFVEDIALHPAHFASLVKLLVNSIPYLSSFPLAECTDGSAKMCRSVEEALHLTAAYPVTIQLCSRLGTPQPQRESPLDRHICCPNGHQLVVRTSSSLSCDVCGNSIPRGLGCHQCNFDICSNCHDNEDVDYQGGEPVPVGHQDTPLAHLMSTMGDVEQFFRNGRGNSMRRNLDHLLMRIAMLHMDGSRGLGRDLRLSQLLDDDDSSGGVSDPVVAELQPGERLQLYTEHGRLRYHETVFSVLLAHHLSSGRASALATLESLLMRTDAHPMRPPPPPMSRLRMPARVPTGGDAALLLHVFPKSSRACACGALPQRPRDVVVDAPRCEVPLAGLAEVKLLRMLHNLNAQHRAAWPAQGLPAQSPVVRDAPREMGGEPLAPRTAFVSTEVSRIVAKAAVASALRMTVLPPHLAMPRWLMFVVDSCPFVVSATVRRHLASLAACGARKAFFACVTQGNLRAPSPASITPPEWRGISLLGNMGGANPASGKFVVDRARLIEDAEPALLAHAESRNALSVEFKGDLGTGLGPTMQFYTSTAREVARAERGLWYGSHQGEWMEVMGEGLYPKPRSLPLDAVSRQAYRTLGMLTARAMCDGKVVPLPMNPLLFRHVRCTGPFHRRLTFSVDDIQSVDPQLYSTLRKVLQLCEAKQKALPSAQSALDFQIREMAITFTLPGRDEIELVPGGAQILLDSSNVDLFMRRLQDVFLHESVAQQCEAFVEGFFEQAYPWALHALQDEELVELLCGIRGQESLWTREEVQRCLAPDHGYSTKSDIVKWLIDVLVEFDVGQQSKFLEFVTGCPRLPLGGLPSLGTITVVRKDDGSSSSPPQQTASPHTTFATLPSVNTCFRYLKIPPYPNKEMLRMRLLQSITESGDRFELS